MAAIALKAVANDAIPSKLSDFFNPPIKTQDNTVLKLCSLAYKGTLLQIESNRHTNRYAHTNTDQVP